MTQTQNSKKPIRQYNAYTMSDVYTILSNICNSGQMPIGQPLWFRGQHMESYALLPSIFRERDNSLNTNKSYSTLSLAEEYRHQNFAARVHHLTGGNSKNRVEWQELFQHHFGKTRYMDWSESLETAINFALEAFIDSKNTYDNEEKRRTSTPNIWILNPYKLNEYVYDYFAEQSAAQSLIKKSLLNLFPASKANAMVIRIQRELKSKKDVYFSPKNDKGNLMDISINGLLSVCILDDDRHNEAQMARALETFEFNPFFYLVRRFYADALPVMVDVNQYILPPLASVQPYHSERIRAQRGTFTVFPNYCRTDAAKAFINTKMDVITIEAQKHIADCFCSIRLCDPVRIAKELIYSGERRPELYPDVQIYADFLETQLFYL